MADFAAAGEADAARLTDAEGREVVVQQEVLPVLAFQRVDDLLVLAGAQRRHHEALGLAAGEQGGAVGARQHRDLAVDRTDGLGVAAVDTHTGIDDVAADHVRLERLQGRAGTRLLLFGELFEDGLLGRGDFLLAGQLVLLGVSLADGGLAEFADLRLEVELFLGRLGHRARLLGRPLGDGDDQVDHVLVGLVTKHDRAEHDVLGKLMGFPIRPSARLPTCRRR